MRRRADDRDEPSDAHIAYVGRFLGGLPVTRLAFFDGLHTLRRNGDTLDISMRYAGLWIQRRIDWMLEPEQKTVWLAHKRPQRLTRPMELTGTSVTIRVCDGGLISHPILLGFKPV